MTRKGIIKRAKYACALACRKCKWISNVITNITYPKWMDNNGQVLEDVRKRFRMDKEYSVSELHELYKDVYFCSVYYSMEPEEYFRYRFDYLSYDERNEYVSQYFLTHKFSKICDKESKQILSSKEKTALLFGDYFNRDVVCIKDMADKDKFLEFIQKHKSFIRKPLISRGGGHGVSIINVENNEEQIFQSLIADGSSLCEQIIEQADGMKKYHPQSVNTIRVVTCMRDQVPEIVQTSIRIGMGDSVVDNGCLSAAVDISSGEIITPARNAHSAGLYESHPDTNERILGSIVPHWTELMEMMKVLPCMLPNQQVIGWDMALSNDGWVMIEGNTNPAIQILAGDGIGVKRLFDTITTK